MHILPKHEAPKAPEFSSACLSPVSPSIFTLAPDFLYLERTVRRLQYSRFLPLILTLTRLFHALDPSLEDCAFHRPTQVRKQYNCFAVYKVRTPDCWLTRTENNTDGDVVHKHITELDVPTHLFKASTAELYYGHWRKLSERIHLQSAMLHLIQVWHDYQQVRTGFHRKETSSWHIYTYKGGVRIEGGSKLTE